MARLKCVRRGFGQDTGEKFEMGIQTNNNEKA